MILIRGVIYEEVEIFGSPDHIDLEAAWGRCSGYWTCAWTM